MTGQYFEALYDVIFHPQAAMRQIAAARPFGQALATFLLSVLIPLLGLYVDVWAAKLSSIITMVMLLHIFGTFLLWFSGAAIFHLLAELSGGHGSAAGLFAALGFTHLPRIFIVPLWVIASLLPDGLRTVAFAICIAAIMVWTLTLDVLAIRGTYNFSSAKAVMVLIMPFLTLVVGVAILATYIGAAFRNWPFS